MERHKTVFLYLPIFDGEGGRTRRVWWWGIFLMTPFQRLFARLFRRNSLRGRLIRLASLWFTVALIAVSIFLTSLFAYASTLRFQTGIDLLVTNLYSNIHFLPDNSIDLPVAYDPRLTSAYSGLYWEIREVDGKNAPLHVYRSPSLNGGDLAQPPHIDMKGNPQHYDGKGPLSQPLRLVSQYLIYDGHMLIVTAGEDTSKLGRDVWSFGLITGLALLVLALGSLVAIYFQVRIGLRPLFDLTDEIARVESGDQQRLTKVYPAEITPVARQINAFLEHAQEVVERQRMHVGNLAHALKTPLSVLVSASEGEGEANLSETVRRQTETMRAQVDHHLRRARAAARASTMGERTPVEPVFDELAVTLEQVFQDKGVIIDWRAPDDLSFRGEKQDLQEIAGNLIENACIWCKGKVRLSAVPGGEAPSMTGHTLSLIIEDDGPGMDESRYDEVLKRGARLDESVPGTGLGLSIVDELVRAYGGALKLERSTLGGLKVTAVLPGLVETQV